MRNDLINSYFKRSEFACPCGCGFDTVDYTLLTLLTRLRAHFGRPVTITRKGGACRCQAYNAKIDGAQNSQHLVGQAADIVVRGITPQRVYDYLDSVYPNVLGLGVYAWHVHVDVRKIKARWGNK